MAYCGSNKYGGGDTDVNDSNQLDENGNDVRCSDSNLNCGDNVNILFIDGECQCESNTNNCECQEGYVSAEDPNDPCRCVEEDSGDDSDSCVEGDSSIPDNQCCVDGKLVNKGSECNDSGAILGDDCQCLSSCERALLETTDTAIKEGCIGCDENGILVNLAGEGSCCIDGVVLNVGDSCGEGMILNESCVCVEIPSGCRCVGSGPWEFTCSNQESLDDCISFNVNPNLPPNCIWSC